MVIIYALSLQIFQGQNIYTVLWWPANMHCPCFTCAFETLPHSAILRLVLKLFQFCPHLSSLETVPLGLEALPQSLSFPIWLVDSSVCPIVLHTF